MTMKAFSMAVFCFGLNVCGQGTILNGNFEQPQLPSDAEYRPYAQGQTLFGWLISQGNVDLVAASFVGGNGTQTLDLNGEVPGAIEQTLNTVSTQPYLLSWGFRSNPIALNWDTGYKAQVLWNGAQVASWEQPGTPRPGLQPYQSMTALVTGTGNDILTFRSLNVGNGGFLLDDIAIVAVPEPGIVALISLGSLSLIFRRRFRR